MERTLRDFIIDQDALRKRFAQVYKRSPTPWTQIAKEMDMSPITIKSFIMDQRDLLLKQLVKVENWIIEREKQFHE